MTAANIICAAFFMAFLLLTLDRIRVSSNFLPLDGGDGPC